MKRTLLGWVGGCRYHSALSHSPSFILLSPTPQKFPAHSHQQQPLVHPAADFIPTPLTKLNIFPMCPIIGLRILLAFCLLTFGGIHSVAHFRVKSVGARSVVIEMIEAQNVSRFDMRVLIYDLEKLREFRRSELTGARYNAQLFSFDGLLPANWFAFRIEYRLIFRVGPEKRAKHFDEQLMMDNNGNNDLTTKQELIVRTRTELQSDSVGREQILNEANEVEDEVVQFDKVQLFPEMHQLNITLSPVFAKRPRINTLIVAELQCSRGTIKPQAQQLSDYGTVFSFDLKRVHPEPLPVERKLLMKTLNCANLCVFPFVRVEPTIKSAEEIFLSSSSNSRFHQQHQQQRYTFRAREICEALLQDDDDEEQFGGPSSVMERNAKFGQTQNGWPNARHKLLDRRGVKVAFRAKMRNAKAKVPKKAKYAKAKRESPSLLCNTSPLAMLPNKVPKTRNSGVTSSKKSIIQ
ncbi:hypothetical protein niasHT_034878 [Heterodera trifolii]|uniref:Uncharacterized protein n=1 Tax=Heterodera trifolii TaxID=157864 RepID=A0ABD2I5J6_9BILA